MFESRKKDEGEQKEDDESRGGEGQRTKKNAEKNEKEIKPIAINESKNKKTEEISKNRDDAEYMSLLRPSTPQDRTLSTAFVLPCFALVLFSSFCSSSALVANS